jgi:hypothetical protein
MSLNSVLRFPSRRRHAALPSPRRRHTSLRPTLEGLEDRLVLSQGAAMLAQPAQAEVHVMATRAPQQLSVPITVTGIDVTGITRDATTGVLNLAGTLTGTILGQDFTTPLTGTITPARNPRGVPVLELDLQPIHLSLLGLNVDTSAICLDITARRGGLLGNLLGGGLAGVLGAASGGSTTQATSQLNTLLNNAQLLNAFDRTFSQARARISSLTPAQGGATPVLDLSLGPVRLNLLGLNVRLDNCQGGPVTVEITATPGGGLLGNLLGGLTGGKGRALVQQVAGVLQQITSTHVPLTPATLPSLLTASSPPASTAAPADPTILNLTLNPIDLNLLGLEVKLYGQDPTSPVTVTVSAQPGSGQLLGNLLTTVAGLLNVQGVSNALDTVLNSVIGLVNQSTLSVNGQTSTATPTSTTPVLDAFIAPVHLDLLGAVVDTSPIHLQILAHAGNGLLLGNIVTDLANLLNNPSGNLVKDVERGLTNLLNELNQLFPTIGAAATPSGPATGAPGSFQILSLTVPPIDLNLLGLILQTSTIQVNATSQTGNGNLLGNLLFDLLNTAHASQSDLNTINADLNAVLAKVVGVLNATTLTLPSGALGSLTPILQQLASPTLINTTGGAVAPQPVLNLNIASNNGSPPVDVNLLGVVVTTSNIQVQLLAQPGDGLLLGTLVYNVSHLLDGGLLGVLSILNGLGV